MYQMFGISTERDFDMAVLGTKGLQMYVVANSMWARPKCLWKHVGPSKVS